MSDLKGSIERQSSRRKDIIRMNFMEIWFEGFEWIEVGQDRVQCRAVLNTTMNLRDP
jgi:hypothetical protein